MTGLTNPQLRALMILGDVVDGRAVAPRKVAQLLWPDSPGWAKRSRRFATAAGGALGATMPMKAATLLWRLHAAGLATVTDDNQWRISPAGRSVLASITSPPEAWRDRHGDVWTVGDDGLMHSVETAPFPRAHVEKKWGPLVPVTAEKEIADAAP